MSQACVATATMMCSFGAAPSVLTVTSDPTVLVESKPLATIMDFAPIANIPPFGVCSSLANPTVASATAAALGVLTPMPCVPVVTAPWVPGSPTVLASSQPVLNNTCQAICAYGGVITISVPGQVSTQVP